ncbi:class I SAM-dependent methyltransferase, partial [Virgisporangium aurantiacum]|uniref:class I SAM-dependent methyltransferase n=1 Tax=Virgisporangium aurantiacum TaxID=175570 RepID=UPI001EF325F4
MREWVAGVVGRVAGLGARRVLEIGCGSGLLLWRLAGGCDRYVGTDFSAGVVARLAAGVAARGWGHVEVVQAEAIDTVEAVGDRAVGDRAGDRAGFDLVVVNSVVQYFPDRDYLRRVLIQAVRLLAPGGRLFVGDVRSLPLLEAAHAWAQPGADRSAVVRTAARDPELVIDPRWFTTFTTTVAADLTTDLTTVPDTGLTADEAAGGGRVQVGHVQVMPKSGRFDNEMTRFRYDVIIHLAPAPAPLTVTHWYDWQDWAGPDWTPTHLTNRLTTQLTTGPATDPVDDAGLVEGGGPIGLRAIPNPRLADLTPTRTATGAAIRTAGTAGFAAGAAGSRGIHPDELTELATAAGYHTELSWAAAHPDGAYDAVLTPHHHPTTGHPTTTGHPLSSRYAHFPPPPPLPPERHTNQPLTARLHDHHHTHLIPALREHLTTHLPRHMHPTTYHLTDHLPTNPNGKIDRTRLPNPDTSNHTRTTTYQPPTTPTQHHLTTIWTHLLNTQPIGINDNFFNLGGHSLLATQLISRIRTTLNHELPLTTLFNNPTINQLATI